MQFEKQKDLNLPEIEREGKVVGHYVTSRMTG